MKNSITDPVIKSITNHLVKNYNCHTVILYGSRARGAATSTSDYDIVGIRKSGPKTRIAKKKNGQYWDVFVYPEKDLKKLNEVHLSWRDAKVLFEQGRFGRSLVLRIQKLVNKPFEPLPKYEIDATKAWARKQLERYEVGDVHGMFRRTELLYAAVEDYFRIRKKRYSGPKAGLQWLELNDPKIFKLFERVLKAPANDRSLKSLITLVYKIKLK